MTTPLETKAVQVKLNIGLWTGRKLDKEVTDEVNQRYHADADASRTNKLLLPAHAFKEVFAVSRTSRVLYREWTQPWFDKGDRILPSVIMDKFTARFRDLRAEYDAAADNFTKEYPKYLSEKKRLGGMFKFKDYPLPGNIRSHFSMRWAFLPIQNSDFRLSIAKENLEDTKIFLEQALQDAMKEPVRRILVIVGHMAERLKQYKPATGVSKAEHTFRDSLVGNVQELVGLLSAFNLTNDPKLAALTERMEKELCSHNATILREDEQVRKIVAKNAEDILKKAAALMA